MARSVSMGLALVLGILSASYFGTSADKDCYLIAQALPALLTSILVGGTYSTLLLLFTEIASRGQQEQIAYAKRILRRLTAFLIPFLLLALLVPQHIVRLIAPGFAPPQVQLCASLLRITSITMAAAVYFAVIKSLFNSWKRFATPGLVNLLIGLISIAVLVVLTPQIGIFALAVGPLAGSIIAVMLLWRLAVRTPIFALPPPPAQTSGSSLQEERRRFWQGFVLLSVAANASQANLLIDNFFASYLPLGTIAMLGFAFVIITNAQAVTTFSLAEVALPQMASAAQVGPESLGTVFRTNLRYMVIITAPLTVGAVVFGRPLVRLLFERGEFDANSTNSVTSLLACYGFEILFRGYSALCWRLLVSRRRLSLIAWASLAAVVLNATLDYILIRPFGAAGIAIATPLVTLIYAAALTPFVKREVDRIHDRGDWGFLVRVLVSSLLLGGVTIAWASGFETHFDVSRESSRVLEVLIGLALGAGAYLGALYMLRVREMRDLTQRLLRALPFLST